MTVLPCPNCSSELAFLEQYRRNYCYACDRYAPEGYGEQGAKICPSCSGILSYVAQYDRLYCYRCNSYPPDGVALMSLFESTVPSSAARQASDSVVVLEPVAEPPAQAETRHTSMEVRSETGRQPEEIPREPHSAGEPPSTRDRRPLDREEVLVAKKPLLMDLCKQYGLSPTGTKEELRERLLSYIDELEAASRPQEVPQAEEQAEPSQDESEASVAMESMESTVEVSEVPVTERETRSEAARSTWARSHPAMVEDRSAQSVEPVPTAMVITETPIEPARTEPSTVRTTFVSHPCPTCGRELTYISQYGRYYCYSCSRYAPRAKAKFACPTCGTGLRWIQQYGRWWCESCRRYAPADLPRPDDATATTGSATAVRSLSTTTSVAAITHRHQSPGSGIGLVWFGVVLFMLYEVLVDLPAALSYDSGVLITPNVAWGLRFFGFFFVAVGAILGLSAVRHRR